MSRNNRDETKGAKVFPGEPARMCVICRRRFPKGQLTRYGLTTQGILTIDADKTRPGRGWYVCSDPACAAKFVRYRPGARRKGGTND